MEDECNSCIQSKLVEKLDQRVNNLEKEVDVVKEKATTTATQTTMIFTMLSKIENNIDKIASQLNAKPSTLTVNDNVKSVGADTELLKGVVAGNSKLLYVVIGVLAVIALFSIGMNADDIAKLMGR